MNTDDLSLFIDVARLGSFAAVAKARGVDASSVSRSVALLEAQIGVRLFHRTTRSMSLTEAGDLYLSRAMPLIDELNRVGAEARNLGAQPSGVLRMSASVTFGQIRIVPILGAFRARYPRIQLDCVFTDANVDLVSDRVDLAIRLAPTIEGDVVVTKLGDTRYRVVASQAYRDITPPLDHPSDMAHHRALLFPVRGYRTRWLFRDAGGKVQEQKIAGDLVISPASALIDATRQGLGPALLPDWAINGDLATGRLVDCFPDWDVTATTFDTGAWMIYPSRSFLPAKVRAMIDFLRETWR